jgi:hypothetical protein
MTTEEERPDAAPRGAADPFSKAWWLQYWWLPLILILIGGAFTIYASRDDGEKKAPAINNVADEAAARPSLWSGPVTKFPPPPTSTIGSIDVLAPPTFDGLAGDVEAYTPREAVERAADLAGKTVVLVGRFMEGSAQDSKFGVRGVVRLRGREPGFDAYIGLSSYQDYGKGSAGWAVVRIVATGATQPTGGGRWRSVYAVTDYLGKFELGEPGSGAIQAALDRSGADPDA